MVQKFTKRVLGEGKFLRLCAEDRWEFVERMNSNAVVAILAITDDRKIVLVDQARHSLGKRVIELPAGLVGDEVHFRGESLETAARRELLEETGYEAARLDLIASGPTSAGLCAEFVSIFNASGLVRRGPGGGDAHENIVVHEVPLAELRAWLKAREGEYAIDLKIFSALHLINS